MAFFDIFRRKTEPEEDKRHNYSFNEQDRDMAQAIRNQKAELKKLQLEKEAELAKLRYEKQKMELLDEIEALKENSGAYEETEEENSPIDKMLMLFMANMLNKNNAAGSAGAVSSHPQQTETAPAPAPVVLSDSQLQELWDRVPRTVKKIASKMDDDTVLSYIRAQMPAASEDTLKRALIVIRGR